MPRILIVGASIAGLSVAALMKKSNLHNILVVDPRAGNYTRPGVLPDISDVLKVFPDLPKGLSSRNSIKHLERRLFEQSLKLHTPMEQSQFIGFEEGIPVIQNTDGIQKRLDGVQYVIDCTGQKRAVFQAVNAAQASSVIQVPHSTQFIAQINPPKTYTPPSEDNLQTASEALDYIKLQKCRELGWPHFWPPAINPLILHAEKAKMIYYGDCPPGLNEEQLELWVKNLLPRGNELCRAKTVSKAGAYKPNFNTFDIQSTTIDQVVHTSKTHPTIIAAGDCIGPFDYRLAVGVSLTLRRAVALLGCFEYRDSTVPSLFGERTTTRLDFNAEQYTQVITHSVAEQVQQLEAHYRTLQVTNARKEQYLEMGCQAVLRHDQTPERRQCLELLLRDILTAKEKRSRSKVRTEESCPDLPVSSPSM